MKKNMSIVFNKPKEVILKETEIKKPEDNEVLIETIVTLISIGTELTVLAGNFDKNSEWDKNFKFPSIPGYDNIGKVIEVGKNIDKNLIGKVVASYGTHSSYVTVNADEIFEVPDGVPYDEAVFFTISHIVMNGIRKSKVTWGENVAVYGLGLLGQFTVLFNKILGAVPIIAVDTSPFRRDLLPKDDFIITTDGTDMENLVKEKTNNQLLDIVFEVTGNADLINKETIGLKEQGKLIILSSPTKKTYFDFHDNCNRHSYTIIGAHNYSHPKISTPDNPWTIKRHVELFFKYLKNNSINIKPFITKKIKYTDSIQMYNQLLSDRSNTMGIVIDWNN